jgi:hypothetical protein
VNATREPVKEPEPVSADQVEEPRKLRRGPYLARLVLADAREFGPLGRVGREDLFDPYRVRERLSQRPVCVGDGVRRERRSVPPAAFL